MVNSLTELEHTDNIATEEAINQLQLPFSASAENSVIGGLILNNEAFDAVSEIIDYNDFYQTKTSIIFKLMTKFSDKNEAFDTLVLLEELKKNSWLDKIGGENFLLEIAANTPTISNLMQYAKSVKELSIRRKLIQVSKNIADRSYEPKGRDADMLLDLAEADIFSVAQNRAKVDRVIDMPRLLDQTMQTLDYLTSLKGELSGLSTGFVDLDKLTSGLQKSDLIILAGRPSMGKTSLAMNIVENILKEQTENDGFALVFSMEMPSEQLMIRMLASMGKIDQTRMRKGELTEEDWAGIVYAMQILHNKRLFIDDSANLTPNQVKATTRRLVKEWGKVDIIVLDYLQLMHSNVASENRTNEISEISRSLKAVAKEFNCPVVALSQLNRSLENRSGKDKRPIMSDLRESGAIEQDADVIAFVYRDEVYHKDDPSNKGLAELIIGKQRNGPIGTVHLSFKSEYTRFFNLDNSHKYDDLDMDDLQE